MHVIGFTLSNIEHLHILYMKGKVSRRTVSHVTFTWGVLYSVSLLGLAFACVECVPRYLVTEDRGVKYMYFYCLISNFH